MYSIHNGAIRWIIPDFLSHGNSNVCSISWHLQVIHTKVKFLPWKWRSGLRSRWTGLVPFDCKCLIPYRWIFPQNFSYRGTYAYRFCKCNTHTWPNTCLHVRVRAHIHIHKHTARNRGDDYRFASKYTSMSSHLLTAHVAALTGMDRCTARW